MRHRRAVLPVKDHPPAIIRRLSPSWHEGPGKNLLPNIFLALIVSGLVISLAACTGGSTSGGPDTIGAADISSPDATGAIAPIVSGSPTPITIGTRAPRSTLDQSSQAATSAFAGPVIPTKVGTVPDAIGVVLPDAPDRNLYQLARELLPDAPKEIPRVVNPQPVTYAEGRLDTFFLVDLQALEIYERQFELRLVSSHAYWYVQDGLSIRKEDLERSAAVFEEDIYPRITAVFGNEWSPGVDNDPHLNIINGRLRGVAGYFSSGDEYPKSVFPFSNQREIIYLNTAALPMGSSSYLEALSHELQHAIHWNGDPSEDTWVNEGLSELATTVAGFRPGSQRRFLRSRPVSLVNWPLSPVGSVSSYGAASLFMHYLVEHYGSIDNLRPLVEQQEDSIAGIDAYLMSQGHQETFRDVFGDWAIANFLDEDGGLYGYSTLDVKTNVSRFVDGFSQFKSEIPQYSVEYVGLTSLDGPVRLRFQAPTATALLPTDVGPQGCWWSNSGDSIDSTLTRTLDLTGLERATLRYQVWYQLEEKWDYAYVELSTDGGLTWQIQETPNTSPENPIGNNFGSAYTGDSKGWLTESLDISRYAGREVLLRFQYITDDAINGPGLCLRQISVPEITPGDLTEGWDNQGFVLTGNLVRQDYIVQVIQVAAGNQVTKLALDETNTGEMVIDAPQDLDRLVVAVAALAPKTREPAPYTLTVEPAT